MVEVCVPFFYKMLFRHLRSSLLAFQELNEFSTNATVREVIKGIDY